MSLPTWQPGQIPSPDTEAAQVAPPVVPHPSQAARKGQDRTTAALLAVAALVAVGGIGFALGHATTSSSTSNTFARPSGFGERNFASLPAGQTFNPAQLGELGRAGSAAISGTVTSFDGTTLTILEPNGSSVSVDIAGTTTYHGETSATSSQVTPGSSVTVTIDTSATTSATPSPGSSVARTLTARDVLISAP